MITVTIKKILSDAADAAGVPVYEWAVIPSSSISFSPELLDSCKTNVCGYYNKSWTCPPACASWEEQRDMILAFKNALVFTTMHKLEDSFDYEGMTKGRELHALLTAEIKKQFKGAPVFGAGSCPVCADKNGKTSCAFPAPCPYPEKKIGSIEAAGIDVSKLSKTAMIAYNNGNDTVTYFSIILFN